MTAADILDFRLAAQMGYEDEYPATIVFPGAVSVVCAGGTVRHTGAQMGLGGMLSEYALGFRVRKELLSAVPAVGSLIQFGGVPYRLMKVSDPATDVAYLLGADNINK